MTKQKGVERSAILEKAIRKAIDGGWNKDEIEKLSPHNTPEGELDYIVTFGYDGWEVLIYDYEAQPGYRLATQSIQLGRTDFDIIFNHDFAKALWGQTNYDEMPDELADGKFKWDKYPLDPYWSSYADDTGFAAPMWQYHLQRMAIADDPIKYLGENL